MPNSCCSFVPSSIPKHHPSCSPRPNQPNSNCKQVGSANINDRSLRGDRDSEDSSRVRDRVRVRVSDSDSFNISLC